MNNKLYWIKRSLKFFVLASIIFIITPYMLVKLDFYNPSYAKTTFTPSQLGNKDEPTGIISYANAVATAVPSIVKIQELLKSKKIVGKHSKN